MDADEDPGGPVLPTFFYGLWPRGDTEDGEADDLAEDHAVLAGSADG